MKKVLDVLKELEWGAIYSYCTGYPCCPICRGIKPGYGEDEHGNLPKNQGHSDSCQVKEAIIFLTKKLECQHEWVGMHGHPAAYECTKCETIQK